MRPAFHAAAAAFGPRPVRAVEVGVYYGVNADVALTEWPHKGHLHLTLVDHDPEIEAHIAERLGPWPTDAFRLAKGDSAGVAATFPDESFDFVYIDDDHTLEGVLRSIRGWLPKVKHGGIIGGHDYAGIREVRQAVIEVAQHSNAALFVCEEDWWFVRP